MSALIGRIQAALKGSTPPEPVSTPAVATAADEKGKDEGAINDIAQVPSNDGSNPEKPGENFQRGVQHAEAVTLTWTKWELIAVFVK